MKYKNLDPSFAESALSAKEDAAIELSVLAETLQIDVGATNVREGLLSILDKLVAVLQEKFPTVDHFKALLEYPGLEQYI